MRFFSGILGERAEPPGTHFINGVTANSSSDSSSSSYDMTKGPVEDDSSDSDDSKAAAPRPSGQSVGASSSGGDSQGAGKFGQGEGTSSKELVGFSLVQDLHPDTRTAQELNVNSHTQRIQEFGSWFKQVD